MLEAASSLQLCAGQLSDAEAAIHTVRSSFDDSLADCVLLVDATSAFNFLNRQTALQNSLHLCPALAKIIINCYRQAADLLVGCTKLKFEEGTTQRDPLAMPIYALASTPLIRELSGQSSAKQVWYADDSAAVGSLTDVCKWWDTLTLRDPSYGFFANIKKTWLVVMEVAEAEARELFTDISITSADRPYLGAPLGTPSYVKDFVCA